MERKQFLRGLGLAGAASLIPFGKALARMDGEGDKPTACSLIPPETEGPFPLDLGTTAYYFRSDIREDRTGAPLTVKLKILGQDNCSPLQNVRVNIWHCDKDGVYSGYATPQNAGGSADTKWLRGYQMTDANGEVTFTTIFPGWYSGRICHIHFKVTQSSTVSRVSQLTFDIPAKNAVYAAFPALYTKGADPMTIAADNIFSDGVAYQMAEITGNATDGYSCYLEATVEGAGSGSTGIGHFEKENNKQFSLGQNYPNPHSGVTTIPFTLLKPAQVKFDLFDLNGRRVHHIDLGLLGTGDHTTTIRFSGIGLATGNYAYQIQVINNDGHYHYFKMMTALK